MGRDPGEEARPRELGSVDSPLPAAICKRTKGTPRSGEEELGIALQIGPLPMPRELPLIPSCPKEKDKSPFLLSLGLDKRARVFKESFVKKIKGNSDVPDLRHSLASRPSQPKGAKVHWGWGGGER